jgi:hypothetical protein
MVGALTYEVEDTLMFIALYSWNEAWQQFF